MLCSQEPEELSQPLEHPGRGNPACSSQFHAEAPQILASRGISSPSTPGKKLLFHPLLVIIPSKHSWLMAPSPGVPLPQAPTQPWCQHLSLASPAIIFYLQTQSSSALQLLR